MAATTSSTSLVPVKQVFTESERLALAGYLAGYRGLTREAYALDLRQFSGWCRSRSLPLFKVRRADIETFAREMEAQGRARATVTRRLCTIARFYRYAVEEELPRLDYESHATALDRNELGALLVAAGRGPAAEHALISLPAAGPAVRRGQAGPYRQSGLRRMATPSRSWCSTLPPTISQRRSCLDACHACPAASTCSSHARASGSTWSATSARMASASSHATGEIHTVAPPVAASP
jgi:hypothetical protein